MKDSYLQEDGTVYIGHHHLYWIRIGHFKQGMFIYPSQMIQCISIHSVLHSLESHKYICNDVIQFDLTGVLH